MSERSEPTRDLMERLIAGIAERLGLRPETPMDEVVRHGAEAGDPVAVLLATPLGPSGLTVEEARRSWLERVLEAERKLRN
jgi:hypothetical protein